MRRVPAAILTGITLFAPAACSSHHGASKSACGLIPSTQMNKLTQGQPHHSVGSLADDKARTHTATCEVFNDHTAYLTVSVTDGPSGELFDLRKEVTSEAADAKASCPDFHALTDPGRGFACNGDKELDLNVVTKARLIRLTIHTTNATATVKDAVAIARTINARAK